MANPAPSYDDTWTIDGVEHRVIGTYLDPATDKTMVAFAPPRVDPPAGKTHHRAVDMATMRADVAWARTWPEVDDEA
jgi:hypothetical protein